MITLATAAQAHAALLRGGAGQVGAGQIGAALQDFAPEELDLSGLQLLIAAHRSASAQGGSLRLAAPIGSTLRAAMERFGLRGGVNAYFDGDYWIGVTPFGHDMTKTILAVDDSLRCARWCV